MIEYFTRSGRTSITAFDSDSDFSAFTAAVSLHAHTHHSRESLAEVEGYLAQVPLVGHRFVHELQSCLTQERCVSDYSRVWWHPPVSPRMVFESESAQIEESLGLSAFVSVTDHDDVAAGLELQALYAARRAPISFEWTIPFGKGFFHLGLHNLPPESAVTWFLRLSGVTAEPTPEAIGDALADLDAIDDLLIVFNHPHWDLAEVGQAAHVQSVRQFLDCYSDRLHALELNGYRSWQENQSVRPVAAALGLPVISGGDRHGTEPNAILNLTRARSFSEFVAEVRSGVSHVLVMPEYRRHLTTRILSSASDILRLNTACSPGRQKWTDRVSWDTDGARRTLSSRWPDGGPFCVRAAVGAFTMLTSPMILPVIRIALGLQDGVLARSAPIVLDEPRPTESVDAGRAA
jgi:hypothetical protein